MGLLTSSSSSDWRRPRTGADDRTTPRTGLRTSAVSAAPAVLTVVELVGIARELAIQVAALFPDGFNRALPRGYTVCSGSLVLLKVQFEAGAHHHLYGTHSSWGTQEASAFLQDIREGWLAELGAFMRWQLRSEPDSGMRFQSELRKIRESVGQAG